MVTNHTTARNTTTAAFATNTTRVTITKALAKQSISPRGNATPPQRLSPPPTTTRHGPSRRHLHVRGFGTLLDNRHPHSCSCSSRSRLRQPNLPLVVRGRCSCSPSTTIGRWPLRIMSASVMMVVWPADGGGSSVRTQLRRKHHSREPVRTHSARAPVRAQLGYPCPRAGSVQYPLHMLGSKRPYRWC